MGEFYGVTVGLETRPRSLNPANKGVGTCYKPAIPVPGGGYGRTHCQNNQLVIGSPLGSVVGGREDAFKSRSSSWNLGCCQRSNLPAHIVARVSSGFRVQVVPMAF